MQRIAWGIFIAIIAALAGCGGGGGGAMGIANHPASMSSDIYDEVIAGDTVALDQSNNVQEPPSPPFGNEVYSTQSVDAPPPPPSANAENPIDAPPPPPPF